ncbi:DNA-binding transcriptional regulator, GntR family [Paenibacillus catalpae]|uniref:DNA-binding transcriptional regulator, GntR family n=1 Tax=Paenibacillus catalpae TaxID=1045775 RepID=A0A1I2DZX3_9BACL|nr:GntR family transcriptional regulator [Paenibacillus catalpae]SFE85969.1 DNA-binding transcriptional regulator, GntR family [Paenibacillus catalpae]
MTLIPPLQPQKQRKTLGDQIYESIRESIVSFRLPPGTMIYENELADTMNVSRTPVREAIRLLVSEQLLEVQPQRGTRIALISVRKVSEARFIREQLELGAFRLAAAKWGERDRSAESASLEALLEQQRAAAEANNIALFMQLDEAFHRAIMEIADNETLLQMIYYMRAHLNRARYLAIDQFGHMDRVVEEHRLLFEAIRSGSEQLAAERLAQHIRKLDQELPQLREAHPDYFQI